jgi:hypothetical protein
MKNDTSINNVSFRYLSASPDFLNLIINNITSCVLLLNSEMMLKAYNDPLKTIFSNKNHEDIIYHKCGNVIGCAYAVEEEAECGTTSYCASCFLRDTALMSYSSGKPIFKQKLSRDFYTSKRRKELKHLQFSTRVFNFELERYILLIIDDITPLVAT